MQSPYGKAVIPVIIFGSLLFILYFFIGEEKAPIVFQIFGLPWSVLFEFDPYAKEIVPIKKMIAEHYGSVLILGILLNALIIYSVSVLIFRRQIQGTK
jgi:hypothetical protein